MTITQLAGSLPRNPRFREWLSSRFGGDEWTEAMAATFIRVQCGITSRREIHIHRDAERRFHNLIRKPFVEWCEQLEKVA